MSKESAFDEKEMRELEMLYPLHLESIEEAKKRQWQLFYYFTLIQGLIIKFAPISTKDNEVIIKIIFALASIFITVISLFIFENYRKDIVLHRKRKKNFRARFQESIQSIYADPERNDHEEDKLFIFCARIYIVVVGLLTLGYLCFS